VDGLKLIGENGGYTLFFAAQRGFPGGASKVKLFSKLLFFSFLPIWA